MGGGVGGRQVHLVAAAGQSDCDRCGDRGFADTTFAHAHNEPVALGFEVVDQRC